MDFRNKVAIVTGGSGDIGGSIARALASSGADVVISYPGNAAGTASTINAVQALGRRGVAVQLESARRRTTCGHALIAGEFRPETVAADG